MEQINLGNGPGISMSFQSFFATTSLACLQKLSEHDKSRAYMTLPEQLSLRRIFSPAFRIREGMRQQASTIR